MIEYCECEHSKSYQILLRAIWPDEDIPCVMCEKPFKNE